MTKVLSDFVSALVQGVLNLAADFAKVAAWDVHPHNHYLMSDSEAAAMDWARTGQDLDCVIIDFEDFLQERGLPLSTEEST